MGKLVTSRITLFANRLHWIRDNGRDDPRDLCPHSIVNFAIDGIPIIDPEFGSISVLATVISLLRTLSSDHTKESRLAAHVFPCCGHYFYEYAPGYFATPGCDSGQDIELRHIDGRIRIDSINGRSFVVEEPEWHDAVIRFADQVDVFYRQSLPKQPADDFDRQWFDGLMREWARRRAGEREEVVFIDFS